MRLLIIIILLGSSTLIMGQYSGGAGDGYASTEWKTNTRIENPFSRKNNIHIIYGIQKTRIRNNSINKLEFDIMDVNGKIVFSSIINPGQVIIPNIPAGFYLIRQSNIYGHYVRKMIIL